MAPHPVGCSPPSLLLPGCLLSSLKTSFPHPSCPSFSFPLTLIFFLEVHDWAGAERKEKEAIGQVWKIRQVSYEGSPNFPNSYTSFLVSPSIFSMESQQSPSHLQGIPCLTQCQHQKRRKKRERRSKTTRQQEPRSRLPWKGIHFQEQVGLGISKQ